MLAFSVYALYLCSGWMALTRWIKYSPLAMKEEMLQSDEQFARDYDSAASFVLAVAYLFVLHTWPVAVYRKLRLGRVLGKS